MAAASAFDERVAAEADIAAASLPALAAAWAAAKRQAEQQRQPADLDLKFSYAFSLSRSPTAQQRSLGRRLLDELLSEDDARRLECTFAMAYSFLIDKEFVKAREFVEALLRMQPDHQKGIELHQEIRVQQLTARQQTTQALGVAAGVAVGVGALLVGIAAAGRNRNR